MLKSEYKILITGGYGRIGSALQSLYNTPQFVYLSSKDCNLLHYDDILHILQTVKPTHVIHLAAIINESANAFMDNILMNMNILKSCHAENIEYVVCCLSAHIFRKKTI